MMLLPLKLIFFLFYSALCWVIFVLPEVQPLPISALHLLDFLPGLLNRRHLCNFTG